MEEPTASFEGKFSRSLDLVVCESRIGLAWIEWEYGGRETVAYRVIDGETVVVDHRISMPEGWAPSSVKGHLRQDGEMEVFCTAWRDGQQRLLHANSGCEARLVPPLAEQEFGDVAVATGATTERELWLVGWVWGGDRPRVELWRREGDSWDRLDRPRSHAGFAMHPAVAVSASGTPVLVWSELGAGNAVIRGVTVGHDAGVTELEPLTFEGHYASHPALVADGGGAVHLACCVERLAELDGGDANWHSRIVTAILDADHRRWCIEGESCIDYAMNPWMAGYAGRRRIPSLVASPSGGARVLFEEKLDQESMSPGPGRLVVRAIGDTTERILLSGHSDYHAAPDPLPDGRIAIGSLTQQSRYERVPPEYRLHTVDPEATVEQRRSGLPGNADCPRFHVHVACSASRSRDGNLQLFFGDPHLHSALSGDLEGDQEQLYHFARDVAHLDFAAFTENDYVGFTHPMTAATWERSRRNAEFFNHPGRFTVFVGWEYTLHRSPLSRNALSSHRSVMFPGGNGPLHCCLDPATGSAPDLVRRLRGERVLLHHHHPRGYDITDDTVERNIEICSGWCNCMRRPEFVERLHGLLGSGLRLGFIGGSDNHERNPGLGGALTGVWAEANTREAIFAAFQQRRAFATTGLRPDLRFQVGDVPMGGTGEVDRPPLVQVFVRCDVPVRSITIVRDGQPVHEQHYAGAREADLQWRDATSEPCSHWYYAHVTFSGQTAVLPWNRTPARGVDAWTSPVWVKPV